MNDPEKVAIATLPTGIPGLDEILGGGIPEYSFNIVAGSPGCGKTTLAHQFLFANATPARPALYFTVLGESAIKMLRHQQQYDFFDPAQLGASIRFINLGDLVMEQNLEAVLDRIVQEVEATNPGIVVVDSFRSLGHFKQDASNDGDLRIFVQRLALQLTSWQVTSLLVGEYTKLDLRDNPVFTVADGLIWLSQVAERNSVVRKLQVIKLRGQGSVAGLHTLRITRAGLQAFSRTPGLTAPKDRKMSSRRLATGVAALDEMLGGGIPEGDNVLVAGPSGTGKSVLATQFIAEGQRNGEPGIIAIFEERPDYYIGRARSFGIDLAAGERDGLLKILYLRPLDLSVDEAMQEILDAVEKIGAKRLVIDSLSGFGTDFRESLYRMIAALTGTGITILSTVETDESFTSFPFSPFSISFLTDDLIRLRYVEIDSALHKIIVVIKMRGGDHSKEIRAYRITSEGLVIGTALSDYRGLITGVPQLLEHCAHEDVTTRHRDVDHAEHDKTADGAMA